MVNAPAHSMILVTGRRPRCYTSTHVLVSSMIFGHKQMSSCSKPQVLDTRSRLNGKNLNDSFADSMLLGCTMTVKTKTLKDAFANSNCSWLQNYVPNATIWRTPLLVSCFLVAEWCPKSRIFKDAIASFIFLQCDVQKPKTWKMPLPIHN